MHPAKLLWSVRAVIYKPFLEKLSFPSYMGKPCFIEGMRHVSIGSTLRSWYRCCCKRKVFRLFGYCWKPSSRSKKYNSTTHRWYKVESEEKNYGGYYSDNSDKK